MCLFERESYSCGHNSRPFAIPGTCWRSAYGICTFMNGHDRAQPILMRRDCGNCHDSRPYYSSSGSGRSTIWLEPLPAISGWRSNRGTSPAASSSSRSSRSVSPFGYYY